MTAAISSRSPFIDGKVEESSSTFLRHGQDVKCGWRKASFESATDDSESVKPRFEGIQAINVECLDACASSRLDVDRRVVEECDPVRRNIEIADHVFEDLAIGFDRADFVRKIEGVDDSFEAPAVERRVEFVGVAQGGDSKVTSESPEKGDRLRGTAPAPIR